MYECMINCIGELDDPLTKLVEDIDRSINFVASIFWLWHDRVIRCRKKIMNCFYQRAIVSVQYPHEQKAGDFYLASNYWCRGEASSTRSR